MDSQRWQYLRARVLLVSKDDISELRRSGEIDESVKDPGWVGRVSYQQPFLPVDRLLERLGDEGWELVTACPAQVPVASVAPAGQDQGEGRRVAHVDVVQDYLFKRPRAQSVYQS